MKSLDVAPARVRTERARRGRAQRQAATITHRRMLRIEAFRDDGSVPVDALNNVQEALARIAEVHPRRASRLHREVHRVEIGPLVGDPALITPALLGGKGDLLVNARAAREWPTDALAMAIAWSMTAGRLARATPLRHRWLPETRARWRRRLRLDGLDMAARFPESQYLSDWVGQYLGGVAIRSDWGELALTVRFLRAYGVPRPLRRAVIGARSVLRRFVR